MKLLISIIGFFLIIDLRAQSQSQTGEQQVDPALAKKITINGICLCQTSLADLIKNDNELIETSVEEMDMCKDRFVQDSRFINWRGYTTQNNPNIIFQKDNSSDLISKIRLTKNFKGYLPDGNYIDVNKLMVKDVLDLYPKFDTWKSRGCSDYWNLTNDTISFFVKIDKSKVPQYPVDESYYQNKPIEGIDIVISCYNLLKKKQTQNVLNENEPLYFLDSIRVNLGVLKNYEPDEISFVSVYKDENAIKIAGSEAKNGAIYIITKDFARNTYWKYLRSKSEVFKELVPNLEIERNVIYLLNNKRLEEESEKQLFEINDNTYLEIKAINDNKLRKRYKASEEQIVIQIMTNK